jgi:predicted AAA+ superfamily ATPase
MTARHVPRTAELSALKSRLRDFPVVAILGARQVGKTTLALDLLEERKGQRFDLEDPIDLARLDDPMTALAALRGVVVIDEVQRRPDLFPALRVLADRPRRPARFLVLGSASPDLLRQTSESLAGRVAFHGLEGFGLDEVGARHRARLWLQGGFPPAFLARSSAASGEWRRAFVRTFVERDLPQLGVTVPGRTIQRFWSMLAHYHAQTWNGAELARALGVAGTTVRRYLDLLAATFVIRILRPWHENLKKRQVRSPKVYLADSGLLHTLLGVETREDLERHPKVGASWEGFALRQLVRRLGARPEECFFWKTHSGAELDLLVMRGRKRLGFEFKRTAAPRATKSMHVAMQDLGLSSLDVIHAGEETYPLAPRVRAVALSRLLDDVRRLR